MSGAALTFPVPKEPPWTDEQWDAITARGCNLLVSAAAGAGKTAVLVKRVICRLTDPVDPVDIDRMLVVTFTDAAAAEMRERIASSLGKLLAKDPANSRLARQVALVNKADISTIHSFCHKVVRQYFYRLDVDPAFRVMDEVEADLLRLEVVDDVFERSYGDPEFGEAFMALVDGYGGARGDDALKDLVVRIYRHSRSRPRPEEWFREIQSAFDLPADRHINDLRWTRVALEGIGRDIARAHRKLAEAVEVAGLPGGPAAYLPHLQAELSSCSSLLDACCGGDWNEVASTIAGCAFEKLPATRSDGHGIVLRDRVKALRDEAKKIVYGIRNACFTRPSEELVDDLRALAPHMQTLVQVVKAFEGAYAGAKRARSLLDFSDLEHLCLEVLRLPDDEHGEVRPSDAAAELARRYEEILVDEYQDINPVQDAILCLVSRGRNSFMVGDVKQSIYRFRLAEPGLFMRKYREFPKAVSGPCRRIDLAMNFRSRKTIINAVNFLFRQLFSGDVGEVNYDPDAELVYGADYPPQRSVSGSCERDVPAADEPAVEVHLIERKPGEMPAGARTVQSDAGASGLHGGNVEGEEEGVPGELGAASEGNDDTSSDAAGGVPTPEEIEGLEAEGRLIARRIRQMVCGTEHRPGPEFLVWDGGRKASRPVSYRDIVVLMRATRERANVLLEVFRQADVPAYAELGTGYFEATEIEVMVSLLQVIDNPRQDIPLAAVLRSPICGFSPDDLARVRTCRRDGDFYSALAEASSRDDLGELAKKARQFLERLDRWRTLARRVPLSILVWNLYRDTRYLDYVGGMPGGVQRQANLRALHERARQFDRFSRQGLFRFLRFVGRLREAEGDLGTARALGEAEDVVRVMSIHKSKGLEFPVVFVADLGKNFNFQDLKGDVLFHSETGLGPMFCDPVRRVKYPTLAYHATRERRRAEVLAEEMRILYVALTRAKEKLILVGSASGLAKQAERWCEDVSRRGWGLSEETLFSARGFLDWIASALARHTSGAPIRDLVTTGKVPAEERVFEDPAHFVVRIWDTAGVLQERSARQAGHGGHARLPWHDIAFARPIGRKIAPEMRRAIEEHLLWVYPHAALAGRAAKVTWSEIKRRFDARPDDAELNEEDARVVRPALVPLKERPRFMQAVDITPAERGQATHLVIQHLDLTRPLGIAKIRATVQDMVARDLLTPELADSVNARAIARFFESDLGRRMTSSPHRVRREVPFCLGIDAKELYPDIPPAVVDNERVVVQGIIDCLIDEPDGFVLIDFKTDAEARYDTAKAASGYRGQIAIYATAVKTIHKRPVKEAYLYFLSAGVAVRIDPREILDSLSGDDDRPPSDDVAKSIDHRLDFDGEVS
ncbi:MAG: UvrD-helicase domain-containing protein [Bacillota bacterium]